MRNDPDDLPRYHPRRDELKRQIKDMKALGLIVVSKDAAELMKLPIASYLKPWKTLRKKPS